MHGACFTSVFKLMWRLVEYVNNCNELEIYFPFHEDQEFISNGSKEIIGASFDNFINAIDGNLIYI